jgi:hypothetical protein
MQLGQKGFEIYPTVKRGHALRRFVTPLTLRCVKSCPAPAPPQSLRNTAAMNQLLVGCSDLPSPIFFSMKSPDASREVVRCPQKNYLFRGKLDSGYSIYGLSCRRCPRIFDLDLSLGDLVGRLSSNRSNAAVNNMPKHAKTCSHVLT